MDETQASAVERTAERPLSPAATISNQMVRLMARYTGRGPTKARTTLNTNLVVVTLQETLTKAELSLLAAGQAGAVLTTRRTFHDVMREEAISLVEEVVGRPVLAFLSDIDPHADVAALVFLLEPRPETGRVQVAVAE